MEKIFDIAKDSEQKWGVIAQGIDGNFEEIERQLSGLVGGESEYTPTDEYNMAINTALTIQAAGSMKVTNPIELKKGKTINVFSNCGSGFYALAKGSNKEPQVGDQLQNLGVEYKGVDAEKEYSYTADEDCFVYVSYRTAENHKISFVVDSKIQAIEEELQKKANRDFVDGEISSIEEKINPLFGIPITYTPSEMYGMAINTGMKIQAASTYETTNAIEVKEGQTIRVVANVGSGFYALVKYSNKVPQINDEVESLGNEYKGVDAEKEYSYTADEDCFVLVSYKKAFEHSIFIQSKSITNQIDDIKKQRNNYSYFLNFDYDITKVFGEHNQQFYESLDVNDFYSKWDELMSLYPNYITRWSSSEADSALSISKPDYLNDINYYCYAFKPKRIRVSDNANKVKILITLGEHSGERVGMWAFYNLMKYICENWRNDKNAEILRTLVEFYVIPCHNPWGFNNNSSEAHPFAGRTNYNNVNLNRNYPSMYWRDNRDEPNGDSTMYATGDWGGNSAGSEYETQVFMYFYNKIKPNVSIDIHTGGVTEYGDTCTIETGCKNNALDVITLVARTTTNNLILGNDIYPQSADVCISSAAYVEEMPNEVYFGLQYDWISQYDEDCICTLIECCANPYKFFAPQSPLSYDEKMTQTLKEQMQFEYNLIMRLAKAASEML